MSKRVNSDFMSHQYIGHMEKGKILEYRNKIVIKKNCKDNDISTVIGFMTLQVSLTSVIRQGVTVCGSRGRLPWLAGSLNRSVLNIDNVLVLIQPDPISRPQNKRVNLYS